MKNFLTVALILMCFVSLSQTRTGWTFSEVVEVPDASKDELYSRGRAWFARVFKSSNDVIQLEDKESGKIIGKGVIMIKSNCSICGMSGISSAHAGPVSFTVEISFKDNKYKYDITGFTHKAQYSGGDLNNEKPACGGMVMTKKVWENIKIEVEKEVLSMIESLKKSEANVLKAGGEDW